LEEFADDGEWLKRRREAFEKYRYEEPSFSPLPALIDWVFVDDRWLPEIESAAKKAVESGVDPFVTDHPILRAALESFYDEGLEQAGPKAVWLDRVEQVRARIAALIGADASEIAFTKNTSEGLNIAANAIPFAPGDNVLMVEGDHPNNAYAFLNLRRKGVEVRFLPMKGETATADIFAPHIDGRTRAISLSHVTFHAGHRFDIEGIGKLANAKGIYLVVDAMQSVGVVPLDAGGSGASMIAFGCHKGLLVPQGLGVLYVRGA
jgi:selenocysteine lyase/cysteine desulfurase